MQQGLRYKVRSIAFTFVAPTIGFLIILVIEMLLKIEVSKLLGAVINLIVVSLVAFVLFPRWLGIPFGQVSTREFLHQLGFYFPKDGWKHLVLGLMLAGLTLSGMLIASILTGEYKVDGSTVNLPHLVFSLNPALWEELFYRGVLMILLLRFTRSVKRAFAIQVVLFGLSHIKGADIGALVDVLSVMVMAIGFTFAAYQTRSLLAGIVFHYFHDAFLYFVQPPDGTYSGVSANVVFYGLLWLMIGVGCVVTRLAVDKFGVRAHKALYESG